MQKPLLPVITACLLAGSAPLAAPLASPLAAPLAGQTAPHGPEVGVRGGVTHFLGSGGSDGFTVLSFPNDGVGTGAAYFTFFTGSSTAIEPQVGFTSYHQGGNGTTRLSLALQLLQFREEDPAGRASAYGFFHGGMLGTSGNGRSDTAFQLGGGAGYRTVVRESLGVRVEFRFRHWLDEYITSRNEISVGLGLGAILR